MNPNTYVTLYGLQIMCSSLRLREEIDVGYVLFEDLQEKCKCVYSCKEEIIGSLEALRSIQLRLLYGDIRLEEAINDIALDVYWARLDLGLESLVAETIPTTFEVCIDAAIGLDDIKAEDL